MTRVRLGARHGRRWKWRTRERAQATVEFALVLPLVMVVIWLGVESSLLVRDQLLVTHASREAARSLAVGNSAPDAVAVGRTRSGFGSELVIEVSNVGAAGGDARAIARLSEAGRLPLLGRIDPGLTVSATVTMRSEGPVP